MKVTLPTVLSTLLPALMLFWPGQARATFTVCNRSFDVANVAVGAPDRSGEVRTEGWWKIGPNQCAEVLREPLATPRVYVFATDVFGRELLSGSRPLCIDPDRFSIRGETDCLIRGHLEARFIEVDTSGVEAWRMFLAPAPE
ncbi:DUF1036 domain-containing protein [Jannaschia aquimarina]|uniref:DUF1036 domain-containing protein n=1 Tax=Jannaschia aquimarina TaxID=935700 RepID=A0A0D1CT16_9RHOB|nr:DUF1036 domain-containing protein [Jannaschia aquimarina]KIT17907.1 hypothetical protein jaqu_03320 [Jannaschia aquimarina]SNT23548.1 Uncharacterized membrane protein [Jannaschia aquimarina]